VLLHRFDDRDDGVSDSTSVTDVLDRVRAERDARNLASPGAHGPG
jgi:hypothetical protein